MWGAQEKSEGAHQKISARRHCAPPTCKLLPTPLSGRRSIIDESDCGTSDRPPPVPPPLQFLASAVTELPWSGAAWYVRRRPSVQQFSRRRLAIRRIRRRRSLYIASSRRVGRRMRYTRFEMHLASCSPTDPAVSCRRRSYPPPPRLVGMQSASDRFIIWPAASNDIQPTAASLSVLVFITLARVAERFCSCRV